MNQMRRWEKEITASSPSALYHEFVVYMTAIGVNGDVGYAQRLADVHVAAAVAEEATELLGKVVEYTMRTPLSLQQHDTTDGVVKEAGDLLFYLHLMLWVLNGEGALLLDGTLDGIAATCPTDQPNKYVGGHDKAMMNGAIDIVTMAGTLAGLAYKRERDDRGVMTGARRDRMIETTMAIYYVLCRVCSMIGLSIGDIARINVAKIIDRYDRGVLAGAGDYR